MLSGSRPGWSPPPFSLSLLINTSRDDFHPPSGELFRDVGVDGGGHQDLFRAGDYCGPGWYGRDLRSLVRTSLDVSPKVVAPGATATLRYRVESAASAPLPVVLRVDYSRSLRPRLSDGGAVPAGPCAHGGSATRRDLLVVLEPGQPLVLELTVNATVERSALPKERAARRPVCQFWTAPLPVGRYRFAPTFGVVDLPPLPDAELEVAE